MTGIETFTRASKGFSSCPLSPQRGEGEGGEEKTFGNEYIAVDQSLVPGGIIPDSLSNVTNQIFNMLIFRFILTEN
jgi:hypothetical protein